MRFSKMKLRQFRNIKEQTIHFNPGLNVLCGSNGHGKTNLIEAIYLLTHGSSFRTGDIQVLINRNDFNGFYLESEVINKGITNRVGITVSGNVKSFVLNEKKTTIPKIKRTFFSILFSPESLQIIKESDGKRRRLIDDLCLFLFPDFSSLYRDCQRLLKQKNSLLRKIKDRQINTCEAEELNRHISLLFFEKSSQLCTFRLKAIEKIEIPLSRDFSGIMNDFDKKISVEYLISNEVLKSEQENRIFNAMYKKWESLKRLETSTGQCLVGPHRHGIRFNFNGKDARFFCSQGQQRAIILAFKTAQAELYYRTRDEFPVLLLDDVLSELDGEKQMNFLDKLLSIEGQIFLTTTNETFWKRNRQSFFTVKEGSFRRENFSRDTGEPSA